MPMNFKRARMRIIAICFVALDSAGGVIDTFDIAPGTISPRRIKKYLKQREPNAARIERFNVRAALP